MDGLLDRASPRRGSLTSLHRYSSGSFSHNPKLGSPSNTLQINNGNFYALCKDLDKFTRYFIVKAVQVIVQSRLGDGQKLRAECKPNGNDWFNINISDIVEVSDKTKAVLEADSVSVRSSWRVCCEISVKTNDGSRVVLEHWIISNRSNLNSNQKLSNSGQASPKSFMANRSLNSHLAPNNGSASPQEVSPGRDRTATFSSSSRTRLNSTDDYSRENNYVPSKTSTMVGTHENNDIKPSTSCYSLSSTQNTHLQPESNNLIIASPSTKSLNTNATATNAPASNTNLMQDHSSAFSTNPSATQQNHSHQSTAASAATAASTNKTSATSSIYTIYNKMSLLLKTLLTTTHIVPAYRLASRTSRTDSCVISYRVYSVPRQVSLSRGSIEDINSNLHHSESPNKRSLASTSSLNSVDIREFVDPEELEHFCPIFKLGSIKTEVSELEVAVCYRTDIRNSSYMMKNSKPMDKYNRILDEDCLTAAKQLLAGNECSRDTTFNNQEYRFRNCDQNGVDSGNRYGRKELDLLDQPLKPAFASTDVNDPGGSSARREGDSTSGQSNRNTNGCDLFESAFDGLLKKRCSTSEDDLINIASDVIGRSSTHHKGGESANGKTNGDSKSVNAQSEPIQVPNQKRIQSDAPSSNLTPGSTPKSLTDSYVFVDLNPPFASEEQNDINSFFHGPSPSFSNGPSNMRDVDELTNQLATIEANASQIDDFVDNMCASEDDEESEN